MSLRTSQNGHICNTYRTDYLLTDRNQSAATTTWTTFIVYTFGLGRGIRDVILTVPLQRRNHGRVYTETILWRVNLNMTVSING